jgi:hypothetical protein
MAGLTDDGLLHLLVHLLYFVQYSALTIAIIVAAIYYQYRERKATGTWSGLLSSHALIHVLLVIYDIIQVFRSQMTLFHTAVTDVISAFLYYFKDCFSIFVLCVVLYVFASNISTDDNPKVRIIVIGLFLLAYTAVTTLFAIIRLATIVSIHCFISSPSMVMLSTIKD